jgi:hypothetical protein
MPTKTPNGAFKLTADANFLILIGYAKGVAAAARADTLSVLHVQLAFKIAVAAKSLDVPQSLATRVDLIGREAAAQINLSLDHEIEPDKTTSWPLDKALHGFLGTVKSASFEEFTQALCEWSQDTAADSKAPVRQDTHFSAIARCSHAIAEHHQVSEFTLELFVAGAALAHQSGLLMHRPAMVQAIRSNRVPLEYLLRKKQWRIEGLRPLATHGMLPENEGLTHAIENAASHEDPLVTVLNLGITLGEKLRELEQIAHHEAGHAVASMILCPEMSIEKATIEGDPEIPGADGYVSFDPSARWHARQFTKQFVMRDLQISLAGRVAEQRYAGHDEGVDQGANSDLRSATDTVWKAITVDGMDEEFGPLVLKAVTDDSDIASGYLFDLAQKRLQSIMKEGYRACEVLINENWQHVQTLAQALLVKPTLYGDEILELLPELVQKAS